MDAVALSGGCGQALLMMIHCGNNLVEVLSPRASAHAMLLPLDSPCSLPEDWGGMKPIDFAAGRDSLPRGCILLRRYGLHRQGNLVAAPPGCCYYPERG